MSERKVKITVTTEDLLTIPQAAKELGVHFATLYRWIDKGLIHPFRLGGQVFLTVDDVKAIKEKNKQTAED